MPNWVSNEITITGDKSKIKEILEKIGTIPVDSKHTLFETLIGKDPDFDKIGWHESNLKNFGTKWDVAPEDSNIEFSEDKITMTPATAWSPPVPFCITLAKEYGVTVEITYSEPGCDFAGRNLINEEGDVIEEEDYDYNEGMYILDRDEFWNDRENDYLDVDVIDGRDMATYVKRAYSYLNEAEQTRLVTIFETILKNQDEEDSGE